MTQTLVHYLVTGFTQKTGIRVYAFDAIAPGGARTACTVQADVALAQKHGIRIQELPLLCRAVLERRAQDDGQCAFTFTENDMSAHKQAMLSQAVGLKKLSRKAAAAASSQQL